MKSTLKLLERIKEEFPQISGTQANVTIDSGFPDGLVITARGMDGSLRKGFARAYSKAEIDNVVDDSILVNSFISAARPS